MKLWPPVGHVPRCVQYCYLIETPGDFTGEKLKAYNIVSSGWVKPLQVLKRLFRQQFWWHLCRFDEKIMTLFCANNMTSNIQHGVTSHYPSVSGEPEPRAFRGWKLGWVAPCIGVPRILKWRRFTSWGYGSGSGGKSPSRALGQSPGRGPGDEEKCEINLQLLTFSCKNLGFNECRSRAWTVGLYFENSI